MNTKSQNKTLGDLGELLVLTYLKKVEKRKAELSEDEFDMEKDIIFDDNKTLEVKTQLPKIMGQDSLGNRAEVFTIPVHSNNTRKVSKQFEKCTNADRLIFVQVPYYEYDYINIWEAPTHYGNFHKEYNSFDDSMRFAIPLKNCHLLYKYVNEEDARKFRKLTKQYKTEWLKKPTWAYNGELDETL